MSFKTQLINFRYEFTDLNRQLNTKRHLIVPVSLPVNHHINALKLLSIALTSVADETPRVSCAVNATGLSPDVRLSPDFYSEYLDLWVFNRALTDAQYKRLSFKPVDTLTVIAGDQPLSACTSWLKLDTGFVEAAAIEINKQCQMFILQERDEIQLVINDVFLQGQLAQNLTSQSVRTKKGAPPDSGTPQFLHG